ncbi:MAG: hypothetical protein ACD_39C01347G0005, partial [uncultured bacterium]
ASKAARKGDRVVEPETKTLEEPETKASEETGGANY